MITSRREQLLGFLLGALESEEAAAVQRELQSNARLREELETLKQRLTPLEALPQDYEAPAGLAERTCAYVTLQATRRLPRPRPAPQRELLAGGASPWSLADAVVFGGLVAAMLVIFFPALFSSIDLARRERCQDNLRTVGQSLVRYSNFAADARFPQIPTEGNRSFAGVLGPLLAEHELLPRPSALVCPSSPLADTGWQVVTLEDIDAASGDQLHRLQKLALGSLGYNLGVTVNGEYAAPRNEGRSHFALMTDAPRTTQTGLISDNHDGRGQNMLFEDNHTAYVVGCHIPGSKDDAFRNRRGAIEAGVGADDSVIGNSATPPFQAARAQ